MIFFIGNPPDEKSLFPFQSITLVGLVVSPEKKINFEKKKFKMSEIGKKINKKSRKNFVGTRNYVCYDI
jgi:hypothetical protein